MRYLDHSMKYWEKVIKKELDSKKYRHSLGVAYTSSCLAMKYGVDMEQAYFAGLFHDIAKGIDNDYKIKFCHEYQLEVKSVAYDNPELLHAVLGAKICELDYDVQDEDLLNAIAYHTTGRPDMSDLEKIVYIADYIEPNRSELPQLEDVRRIAFEDLNRALVIILHSSLEYLNKNAAGIDPLTQETYDYYKGETIQ